MFKYVVIAHGELAPDHVSNLSCELSGPPLYTLRRLQCAVLKDTLIIVSYTVMQSMAEGQKFMFVNVGMYKAQPFANRNGILLDRKGLPAQGPQNRTNEVVR